MNAERAFNGGILAVGSKDQLESEYGAELEGPFGLAWIAPGNRMFVWSYKNRARARAAAEQLRAKALEPPRLEFL